MPIEPKEKVTCVRLPGVSELSGSRSCGWPFSPKLTACPAGMPDAESLAFEPEAEDNADADADAEPPASDAASTCAMLPPT